MSAAFIPPEDWCDHHPEMADNTGRCHHPDCTVTGLQVRVVSPADGSTETYGGTVETCGVLHSHVIPCEVAHPDRGVTPPAKPKEAPCRWCDYAAVACRDCRSGGYIKCCPDCDHRPRTEELT